MAYSIALKPYACDPAVSRGRLYAEEECSTRSAHQRDRDRIIHSAAFRRLEYKTQVFVNHEGDHYRTRLTHSLEVSQLSRSMCRVMGLNEDLAEALALSHDLGHTPFGHAGEDGLNDVMKDYGGFDHNAQTLRILTKLETRYADFDGLNLSWETLEGLAKHNGPVANPPRAMAEYIARQDLELHSFASAEAQISSLADDIAYNNHDLEDGLRAGFFTLDDLATLPMLGDLVLEIQDRHTTLDVQRQTHEVIRRMINRMVNDVIGQTTANIDAYAIHSVDDIRGLGKPIVHFSPQMQLVNKEIKAFLMRRMYRQFKVNRMTSKARRVVAELFTFFMKEPECLPPRWQELVKGQSEQFKAETVADFIAGMTDRFALEEHARVFDPMART